jgi:hypothetical protein
VKGTVNDRHFNWKVCQTLQTEGTFQWWIWTARWNKGQNYILEKY